MNFSRNLFRYENIPYSYLKFESLISALHSGHEYFCNMLMCFKMHTRQTKF